MFDQLSVLGRGVLIGVMIAAPVGPVGLLCMRKTLQHGLVTGFATGFGAALADAFFAFIAAFGVAQITDLIQQYTHSVHLVGGLLLLLAAWHSWFDRPHIAQHEVSLKVGATLKGFATGFMLTITNPMTVFGTLAVVAAFGDIGDKAEAVTLVSGIFTGSSLWWLTLSSGVSLVRDHFSTKKVQVINRTTAVLLLVLGLWALVRGLLGNLVPFLPGMPI